LLKVALKHQKSIKNPSTIQLGHIGLQNIHKTFKFNCTYVWQFIPD
jgi:hypothetical protein